MLHSNLTLIPKKFSSQKLAVTADNFLFWCAQAGDDIRKVLAKSPSERAEKVLGSDGVTYPVVKSQPLPHGYTWDATAEDIGYTKIYLSNYAHGKDSARVRDYFLKGDILARHVGSAHTLHPPKNFLPPEALQGGRMTVESDIWTLGCTVSFILFFTQRSSSSLTTGLPFNDGESAFL